MEYKLRKKIASPSLLCYSIPSSCLCDCYCYCHCDCHCYRYRHHGALLRPSENVNKKLYGWIYHLNIFIRVVDFLTRTDTKTEITTAAMYLKFIVSLFWIENRISTKTKKRNSTFHSSLQMICCSPNRWAGFYTRFARQNVTNTRRNCLFGHANVHSVFADVSALIFTLEQNRNTSYVRT